METHPYAYDTTVQWIPQQNQPYEGRYVAARTGQQPPVLQKQAPQPGSGNQKPRLPQKMPKARTLALARTLKKWLAVASIIGFGTFSGLVALHQVGSATAASQSTPASSGSSQNASSSSSSSQNSNNFLNQQGGNTSGTSSSSSTTVSGTHTS